MKNLFLKLSVVALCALFSQSIYSSSAPVACSSDVVASEQKELFFDDAPYSSQFIKSGIHIRAYYKDASCKDGKLCVGDIKYCLRDDGFDNNPSITYLFVKPEYRRTGVATKLVAQALTAIRSQPDTATVDIYIEAESFATEQSNAEDDKRSGMNLAKLVAFYEKRGAIEMLDLQSIRIIRFSGAK